MADAIDPSLHSPNPLIDRRRRRKYVRSKSRKRTPGWRDRGRRVVGERYRDYVVANIPLRGRFTLRALAALFDAEAREKQINLCRALLILVHEGRLLREHEAWAGGPPRWVYWRPGGA